MLKALAILATTVATPAFAADLLCSREPVNVEYRIPARVSQKKVSHDGHTYRLVYLRKRQGYYNPNYEYTELRVSSDGQEWSIMCADGDQLANMQRLGLK